MSDRSTTITSPRIAFIRARWHAAIVDRAHDGFVDEIEGSGSGVVDVYDVPGALEIPLHAKTLALAGHHDAIVACALVVDGGEVRVERFAVGTPAGAFPAVYQRILLVRGARPSMFVCRAPPFFRCHALSGEEDTGVHGKKRSRSYEARAVST